MNRIVLAIIALFLASLLLLSGTRAFLDSKHLADHGKTLRGEVWSGDGIFKGRRSSSGYHLQIRFTTDDQVLHEENVRVDHDVYTNTQIGDAVTVHYLPENPHICQIGDSVRLQFGSLFRGFLFLVGAIYLLKFYKNPQQDAAKRIGKHIQTLAMEKFEYASVKAEDFKHVDRKFYREMQQHLEQRGFRFLDDQENVTLSQRGTNPRTPMRFLVGSDDSTMATVYHFVPKWSLRAMGAKSAKIVEMENQFSDGSFVCTNNAEMAGKLDSPPGIDALRMPASTSWEKILETHHQRLASYFKSHPGVELVKIKNMADIRHVQAEMQRIKSNYRKRHGLSKSELQRLGAGANFNIEQLHQELTERRERGLDQNNG